MNYHLKDYKRAYGVKRYFMPRYWLVSIYYAKQETVGAVVLAILTALVLIMCVVQFPEAIDKTFDYYDNKPHHDAR